jgi:hypothetical protein
VTKRLEDEFNLPHLNEMNPIDDIADEQTINLVEVDHAISISEKINNALTQVQGMDSHDFEMDDIAQKALSSYQQLMDLGMNMTDMAAGPVFANAANMLKIALEAKDAKVTRKLKQIDLMLKKVRTDQKDSQKDSNSEDVHAITFDRNELLKIISQNKS